MTQTIETPNPEDIERIALLLVHAAELVQSATGEALSATPADLDLLQRTLDAGLPAENAALSLQALGMAFGKVLADENSDYDWWMVQDEYGRDPALRFRETPLLVFPQTMIARRVEEGQPVELRTMYADLRKRLDTICAENFPEKAEAPR